MNKQYLGMHLDVDSFLPATDTEKEYMVQMRPATTFFDLDLSISHNRKSAVYGDIDTRYVVVFF